MPHNPNEVSIAASSSTVAEIEMSYQQQNQFPNPVPMNIIQSYTPTFAQPQNPSSETEYAGNPYNLTLKANDENVIHVPISDANASPIFQNFQSANYFGNDVADIPPGSEMLFGKP